MQYRFTQTILHSRKMVEYPIRQFLLDIGTKSNYEKAQEEWHK